MPVRVIRGGIGSEKSRMCMEEIRAVHEKKPQNRCIMLVPDHYSFETEKAFVDTFGGTGLNNIDVMTPRKMAVSFLSARDLKYLTESGRQMLISRAIRTCISEDNSSPLIRTMRTPGFVNVMESLISEMKRYCVTPGMLIKSTETVKNDVLKNKLDAAAHIYSAYNEFFQNGAYTDSGDDLLRIAEYIRQSDEFNEELYVWADRFDEFFPQHIAIFNAMADKGVNLTIGINYPPDDGKYEVLSGAYEQLRQLKGYEGDIICKERLSHVKSSEIKFLLSNYGDADKHYTDEVNDISLFIGRDAYAETEHTAAEILRLVREEGYRYRDIAVVCGNGAAVSHIVKAVFDEYRIPYFSDETITLADHPIAMQLLSVFDILEDEWSYNSVMRYLRSGFIYDENYKHFDRAEIDRIDNYALKYGVRGRKRWLEDTWLEEANDFERVWGEEKKAECDEKLNAVKKLMMTPLISLHKKIKKAHTARGYALAVFELLEDINMYGGLKKDVVHFRRSGRNDEAQQFSEIWNLIIETLDQSVVTMREREMPFAEYGEYIKSGLSKCVIKTIPSALDSVCVGSVERSTAAAVKALFVTDAVNGTYPNDIVDEGFFSNADRNILKEDCQISLAPDTKKRMLHQYFKVYKAIAPVTDKLFFSYHVQNSEGGALRPSGLISDIREMFEKLEVKDNIITDFSDKSYISSPDATIHRLLINKSSNGTAVKTAEWESAYRWFKNNEKYDSKLLLLETASKYSQRKTKIGVNNALKLFGSGDTVYSASRLNVYAQCPFSYFMQYGLNAKEQEISGIAANDFGSCAHRFIQEFCMRVEDGAQTAEEKSEKWRRLSDSERNGCIDEIAAETKEKMRFFASEDAEKRVDIIDRITKTVKSSAAVVHKSLSEGRYTTNGYEREFEKVKVGDGVYIKGVVDRVDVYDDGKKEYIRIIDYKTGNTGFDIKNILNRVNMQMIIYAIAVKKAETEIKSRETSVSGIFYNRIKDNRISSHDAASAEREHTKDMRLDGVMFAKTDADGYIDMDSLYAVDEGMRDFYENGIRYESDFTPLTMTQKKEVRGVRTEREGEALMQYVSDKVLEIDSEIKRGEFEVSPYEEDDMTSSCSYCAFKEACVFERENAQVRKKKNTKGDCWQRIVEEGGGEE